MPKEKSTSSMRKLTWSYDRSYHKQEILVSLKRRVESGLIKRHPMVEAAKYFPPTTPFKVRTIQKIKLKEDTIRTEYYNVFPDELKKTLKLFPGVTRWYDDPSDMWVIKQSDLMKEGNLTFQQGWDIMMYDYRKKLHRERLSKQYQLQQLQEEGVQIGAEVNEEALPTLEQFKNVSQLIEEDEFETEMESVWDLVNNALFGSKLDMYKDIKEAGKIDQRNWKSIEEWEQEQADELLDENDENDEYDEEFDEEEGFNDGVKEDEEGEDGEVEEDQNDEEDQEVDENDANLEGYDIDDDREVIEVYEDQLNEIQEEARLLKAAEEEVEKEEEDGVQEEEEEEEDGVDVDDKEEEEKEEKEDEAELDGASKNDEENENDREPEDEIMHLPPGVYAKITFENGETVQQLFVQKFVQKYPNLRFVFHDEWFYDHQHLSAMFPLTDKQKEIIHTNAGYEGDEVSEVQYMQRILREEAVYRDVHSVVNYPLPFASFAEEHKNSKFPMTNHDIAEMLSDIGFPDPKRLLEIKDVEKQKAIADLQLLNDEFDAIISQKTGTDSSSPLFINGTLFHPEESHPLLQKLFSDDDDI